MEDQNSMTFLFPRIPRNLLVWAVTLIWECCIKNSQKFVYNKYKQINILYTRANMLSPERGFLRDMIRFRGLSQSLTNVLSKGSPYWSSAQWLVKRPEITNCLNLSVQFRWNQQCELCFYLIPQLLPKNSN